MRTSRRRTQRNRWPSVRWWSEGQSAPPTVWRDGAYACLKSGKTVRPILQLTAGVVDTAANETPERIIERIGAFLVGLRVVPRP
jgi:hypothetical protein